MREPSNYSAELQTRLTDLGLEPVLIGALAAGMYRTTPRFTTDVDFLARSLDGLADAMRADGYEVHVTTDAEGEPYLVSARGDGIQVDVLLAETEYQKVAIDRARNGVLTIEDVVVHKLIAWRPRDRDDIDSILGGAPVLDLAYIATWAAVWEVVDRWEEVRRRFGLG